MSVRQTLRQLVPPALTELLRRRRRGGEFATWEAACRASGETYDADLVNRFRVERAAMNGAPSSAEPGVLLLTALLLGKPDVRIVDFGGNTGDHAHAVLSRLPNAQYTVVENATLVTLARERFAPIRFASDIPAEFDIFFSSCTLQYLEDPRAILRRGFAGAAHACIFVRNAFGGSETIRVQSSYLYENGSGAVPAGFANGIVRYPHRTMIEREIVDIARNSGFELGARLYEPLTSWPGTDDVHGAQLVFLRRTALAV